MRRTCSICCLFMGKSLEPHNLLTVLGSGARFREETLRSSGGSHGDQANRPADGGGDVPGLNACIKAVSTVPRLAGKSLAFVTVIAAC